MTSYLIKRIGGSAVVLFLLSILIFFAGRGLVSGSPALIIAGSKATPETIAAIEADLGLDRPILVQYLDWFSAALRGDFGVSPFSGIETTQVIQQQAPVSFELGILSLIIAVIIGVPIGVVAARRPGGLLDRGLRIPMILIFAIPGFISGSIALFLVTRFLTNLYSPVYISFAENPIGNLQIMILPALAVGIPTAPLIMQITRASMAEVLSKPFIAAARSNGISEWRLSYVYALKAAFPPILTFIGFTFGILIGGLFIVEQIFSLPGLGRGMLQSISGRDFSQLTAQALVLAAAFILGNLVVDLLVPIIDRRIARK